MSSQTESATALAELSTLIAEINDDANDARWKFVDDNDRAGYRRFAMTALHHGLQFWRDADPQRPYFYRWFSPTKKLLGDNPDSLYYGTVIDPTSRFRIRGNISGACYTSFTVEAGTAGGAMSQRLGHTLNDSEFDVDAAGNYELIVSQDEPESGTRNWLRLDPDSGSLTTRHYFDWQRSAALDPSLHMALTITPLDDPGPPPTPDDAAVAAGIRRVITFLRSVTLEWARQELPPGAIPWLSDVPNQFTNPEGHDGNVSIGYAATDNVYRMARWELGPDQALEIRGRFPRCRFANIVLFNIYGATPDYDRRQVSLNRVQTVCEPDGSFRMVLAHRDPGTPNWLDTCGQARGSMFWRYLLPDEPIPALETKLITL